MEMEIEINFNQWLQFVDTIGTTRLDISRLNEGINIVTLFVLSGLCHSKSAARRLIEQGGAYINKTRYKDTNYVVRDNRKDMAALLLGHGKKQCRLVLFK